MLLTALFAKIFLKKTFLKNKKDRDRRQSTDDLSSALPDSHGHPVFHRIFPDYFRWLFPTVKKYP